MDIFIKSFNRIYYLNRCLYSITKHVKNFTGTIYVLDDGTPSIYLEAIKLKYPNVIILKSENYSIKSKLLEEKNYNLPKKIPTDFWYESIKKGHKYSLILEDDIWFKKPINVNEIIENCEHNNIALLKLMWLGNPKLIGKKLVAEKNNIVIYKPNLHYKNPTIFKLAYMKYNRFWLKALGMLNLYSKEKEFQYYSIYSVAAAIYKKDYFLNIWENASNKVDEKLQLYNAVKYVNTTAVNFARTPQEVLKTGFISSAFTKKEYPNFSIHDFNTTLNDYWLNNKNAFCNNLDIDIDDKEIITILKEKGKPKLYIEQWQDWMFSFKESYLKIGCKL